MEQGSRAGTSVELWENGFQTSPHGSFCLLVVSQLLESFDKQELITVRPGYKVFIKLYLLKLILKSSLIPQNLRLTPHPWTLQAVCSVSYVKEGVNAIRGFKRISADSACVSSEQCMGEIFLENNCSVQTDKSGWKRDSCSSMTGKLILNQMCKFVQFGTNHL